MSVELTNAERETLKQCSQCGEAKPSSEFYHKHSSSDGRDSRCKACRKLYDKYRYERVQSKILADKKEYYIQNKNRITERRETTQSRERHRKQAAEYRRRNPDKVKAHNVVCYAIVKGELPRPETLHCAHCGNMATEYHHHSYERDHWLDVVALCHSCHMTIHVGVSNESAA